MFPKARPVPSKAALKVLYQLAYISSGAAVGVATLCLEEQRRKLQLVQRIAENARIIRQSPQYRPNGTTRKMPEHDEGDYEEAIKGPELPTVVEKEYARRECRVDKAGQRWNMRKRDDSNGKGVAVEAFPREEAVPSAKAQSAPTASKWTSVGIRHYVPLNQPKSLENASRQRARKTGGNGSGGEGPEVEDCPGEEAVLAPGEQHVSTNESETSVSIQNKYRSRIQRELTESPIRRMMANHPINDHEILGRFITRNHRPVTANVQLPTNNYSHDDIWHDVIFLARVRAVEVLESGAISTSTLLWSEVAKDLLHLALQHGHRHAINKVTTWLNERKLLSQHDVDELTNALATPDILQRLTEDDLYRICRRVFTLDAFQSMDARHKIQRALQIFVARLSYRPVDTDKDQAMYDRARLRRTRAMAEMIVGSSLGYKGLAVSELPPLLKTILAPLVLRQCLEMVASGRYSEALEIRMGLDVRVGHVPLEHVGARQVRVETERLGQRIKSEFKSALVSGDLVSCAMLLRLERCNENEGLFMTLRDLFINACDKSKEYRMLHDVFIDEDTRIHANLGPSFDGNDQRLAILAVACACKESVSSLAQFRQYFNRLSPSLRAHVSKRYALYALMADWETRRDLQSTLQNLSQMANELRETDSTTARRVLLALLDLQIRFTLINEARATLEQIHELQPSDHITVSFAALMLAKTSKWEALDKLLLLAKESNLLKFGTEGVSQYNAVISAYSHGRTAVETWKFAVNLIHEFGLIPNQETTEIMLGVFICGKAPSMISRWLHYLRTAGHRFDLDAKAAVRLLTQYYREHRPSHVLMMWFCRELITRAPSLAGMHYQKLIKEAIGYDLRYLSGLRKSKKRTFEAQARLHSLLNGGSMLPSPVEHLKNDQHNISCSERTSQEGLADDSLLINEEYWNDSLDNYGEEAVPLCTNVEENVGKASGGVLDQAQANSIDTKDMALHFGGLRAAFRTTSEHDISGSRRPAPLYSEREHGREKSMILALSLKDYARVLDMFHTSLDTVGIPSSPLALEVAVEASLRLHDGDATEAEAILLKARDAGMNVACAMGPILIHQIKALKHEQLSDLHKLQQAVIEYYRMNKANGLEVKHQVGVTAAHVLIRARRPRDGLRILEGIYRSEWAEKKSLDTTAMTVFLRAYAAINFLPAIKWVLNCVLARNMRIDRKFLATLSEVGKQFGARVNIRRLEGRRSGVAVRGYWGRGFLPRMMSMCYTRREEQRLEGKLLGRRLTHILAGWANRDERSNVDVDAWPEMYRAVSRYVEHGVVDLNVDGEEPLAGTERVMRELTVQGGRQRPRRNRNQELRLFLRRDIVLPDGKTLAFTKVIDQRQDSVSCRANPVSRRRGGDAKVVRDAAAFPSDMGVMKHGNGTPRSNDNEAPFLPDNPVQWVDHSVTASKPGDDSTPVKPHSSIPQPHSSIPRTHQSVPSPRLDNEHDNEVPLTTYTPITWTNQPIKAPSPESDNDEAWSAASTPTPRTTRRSAFLTPKATF